METVAQKQKNAFKNLKDVLNVGNPMSVPRVTKVVVSVGVGSVTDKNKIEVIQDRIAKITGQKAAARGAKKSIAAFKSRQGQVVGYQVTLRGQRMRDFLDRLLNIALPRTRDFRGISRTAVDEMGNLTVGVREHTIFPETADEEQRDIFGLAATVVTTAKDKATAERYFEYLGVPFKKEVETKKGKK